MICPKCDFNNFKNSRFCRKCGTDLIEIEDETFDIVIEPAEEKPAPVLESVDTPEKIKLPDTIHVLGWVIIAIGIIQILSGIYMMFLGIWQMAFIYGIGGDDPISGIFEYYILRELKRVMIITFLIGIGNICFGIVDYKIGHRIIKLKKGIWHWAVVALIFGIVFGIVGSAWFIVKIGALIFLLLPDTKKFFIENEGKTVELPEQYHKIIKYLKILIVVFAILVVIGIGGFIMTYLLLISA